MVAWIKFLSIFAFTAIFSLGLIAFIYNIQQANNAQTNILNSPSLSSLNHSMSGFLTDFSSSSVQQQNASLSEIPNQPTGAFILFSLTTSLVRFISLPINLINSLFSSISSILGVNPAILGVISALMILTGIFLWYKSIKQGA